MSNLRDAFYMVNSNFNIFKIKNQLKNKTITAVDAFYQVKNFACNFYCEKREPCVFDDFINYNWIDLRGLIQFREDWEPDAETVAETVQDLEDVFGWSYSQYIYHLNQNDILIDLDGSDGCEIVDRDDLIKLINETIKDNNLLNI